MKHRGKGLPSRLSHFLSGVRQLAFPSEFRIPPPVWPGAALEMLEKLARYPASPPPVDRGSTTDGQAPPGAQLGFLADLGTGLWRLRQKMVDARTGRPLEEMRRAYRHLESVWDALIQAGVSIQDHTDAPYDPGLSLKVVAFQPTPGIVRETVIETIKPSIYLEGRTIQMGEVIVATPQGPAGGP